MFEDFLAEVQPQTEPEWRECFEALQGAKNSLLSVAGVSPMQIVFGRSPEVRVDFLGDTPDVIANGLILHDRGAGQTIARQKIIFHAETMNERRALHLRPRDMVVVWRMVKGALMLGKRSHHRMRPAILSVWSAVRGNCWVTLLGRVMKASPEQLRQAGRENRHAWRLVEGELRAKLVNSDEFSGHKFEDITSGELPPAEEEGQEVDKV